MFWMKLQLILATVTGYFFQLMHQIMKYIGFSIIAVAAVLIIDKHFLGGIITPHLIEMIEGKLLNE